MILELLQSTLSGAVVDEISKQTNLDTGKTTTALNDILPALLGGLAQNAQEPAKAKDLTKALQEDHNGSLLKNLETNVSSPEQVDDGRKIVEHIFGSNQDQITELLTSKLGIDKATVESIMTMAAPVVLEQLGQKVNTQNLNSTDLTKLLQQEQPQIQNALGDLATSLFDSNKNGSVLDEIFEKVKSFVMGLLNR